LARSPSKVRKQMSGEAYTPGAQRVNPNPPMLRPGGLTLLDIVVAVGGGFIPDTGEFNQRVWSMLLGITEGTFRDWLDKYHIPNRPPGNDVYVEASEPRSHLPRRYWHADGESAERTRVDPKDHEGPPQGKVASRRRRRKDG